MALEATFQPSSWGQPMGSSTSETQIQDPATGLIKRYSTSSNGQKNFMGYLDPETGKTFSSYSKKPTAQSLQNWGQTTTGGFNPGSSGGSGGSGAFSLGQAAAQSAQASPVEFFLGSAPTLKGVDLSGAIGDFRNVFNQLNSGVNPNFSVDTNQLASDAKAVAQKLNLSPGQIKQMISGINPSIGEVTAQAAAAAATLNDPEKIGKQANRMAEILNKKYIDQFDSVMPGYKQNMEKTNQITSNYLAGKIPQDVVDQIFRNSAAKGFTTGLYGGGIGRNIVARDLGLTSLQLQSAGAGLLDQTAKLAATVGRETMPVSGESFVGQLITNPATIFSTIAQYNHVDPTAIFNAVYVKPQDVYNTMASMAQQSTMARAQFEASKLISPTQVFSALTDQAQYNSQIANSNALNSWQSQALPGQFDISTGKYIGFKPGERLDTRPTPPGYEAQVGAGSASAAVAGGGAAAQLASLQKPTMSSAYNPRGNPAANARYIQQLSADMAAYNDRKASLEQQAAYEAQQSAQTAQQRTFALQNWMGSAYTPQLRG
jgi:hypothetical protein